MAKKYGVNDGPNQLIYPAYEYEQYKNSYGIL